MKKSFKDRVSSLGLNYQKEVLFLLIINIFLVGLGVASYFFLKNLISVAIAGFVLLISN